MSSLSPFQAQIARNFHALRVLGTIFPEELVNLVASYTGDLARVSRDRARIPPRVVLGPEAKADMGAVPRLIPQRYFDFGSLWV